MKIPNYNRLKYFIKVAELKNITNASNELYISQPSLSRYITEVENDLGILLLKRTKSGVELTPEGVLVYKQCKKLEGAYKVFEEEVAKIKGYVVGGLNIGYQSMSKGLITYYNSKVHEMYPYIQMKSIRQTNDNFIDEVVKGVLDLAFIYGHELEQKYRKINHIPVYLWKKMLMVSKKHPLASRKKIHIYELRDEVFIQTSQQMAPVKTREFFDACRNNGFEPNVLFYVNSFNEALISVITYNAVSIMPYFDSSDELISEVAFIEIEGMDTDYPIDLVWSKTNENHAVSYYVDIVKKELETGTHVL